MNMIYTPSQLALCLLFANAPEIVGSYIRATFDKDQADKLMVIVTQFESPIVRVEDKTILAAIANKLKSFQAKEIQKDHFPKQLDNSTPINPFQ